jgi:uncharacterized LabA/DUF88 family protein
VLVLFWEPIEKVLGSAKIQRLMEESKRVAIFIDGGNFHHLVIKKLGIEEIDFDFEKFADLLADGNTIAPEGKRYYTGTVREKIGDAHSKESMARQTKFFSVLKKGNWKLGTSKLKTRIETLAVDSCMKDYEKLQKMGIKEIVYERKREKGIDVMLTTDMIVGAVENQYDIAIVVSSDGDMIPAINWVRSRGKHVEYIGFSLQDPKYPNDENKNTRPLASLIRHTSTLRVFGLADLKLFIKEPENPEQNAA